MPRQLNLTDEEFRDWFLANLDTMTSMGIMHYNAERAKDVRGLLSLFLPQISSLEARIKKLELANRPRDAKGRFIKRV